jgi:alpha-1,3-glucan synthase
MNSNTAWQRHGCYTLGSTQYFNMPLGKSLMGCHDDWNSLDHFDPTADSRRLFARFNQLRSVYNALQDGFNLVQRGNWTYFIDRPGSNGTSTEMGLWSVSRSGIAGAQTLTGNHTDQVWLLYSNENQTRTWQYDCKDPKLWIASPYQAGETVRNLLAPYETYTLAESLSPYFNNGNAPYFGCMSSFTTQPFGFLALVPNDEWVGPNPALTGFLPGHDARIHAESTDANATTIDITLEFNMAMDCTSVTQSLSFNMSSSGQGSAPTINQGSVNCAAIQSPVYSQINGVDASTWAWSATLENVPDGILEILVNNPSVSGGGSSTGVSFALQHHTSRRTHVVPGEGPSATSQGIVEKRHDLPTV